MNLERSNIWQIVCLRKKIHSKGGSEMDKEIYGLDFIFQAAKNLKYRVQFRRSCARIQESAYG